MHSCFQRVQALLAGLALAGIVCPRAVWASDNSVAVLVMAQPGSSQWTKQIKRAVKQAEMPCPYRLFFGTADNAADVREIQDDIQELEGKGAHEIVVVPLALSSYAPIARQWKYVLGMDMQPGFSNNPLFPVEKHSTVRFMEPLNDSAVVVEIMLDRAQEMSKQPAKEAIVIVAHGPSDDSDNQKWIQILHSMCGRIKERGGFQSVEGFTLRDDAASATRQRAVEALRARIQAINQSGSQAIVLQLLLAPGGIEHKVSLELRGLEYNFNTKTLLPDSRISEWIRSQVP
jgi:sirohydrochlorin cobaltochelatase